jgi:hypothetical protein
MENGLALVNGLAALMELAGGVGFSMLVVYPSFGFGFAIVFTWIVLIRYLSIVCGKCIKVKRVLKIFSGLVNMLR